MISKVLNKEETKKESEAIKNLKIYPHPDNDGTKKDVICLQLSHEGRFYLLQMGPGIFKLFEQDKSKRKYQATQSKDVEKLFDAPLKSDEFIRNYNGMMMKKDESPYESVFGGVNAENTSITFDANLDSNDIDERNYGFTL